MLRLSLTKSAMVSSVKLNSNLRANLSDANVLSRFYATEHASQSELSTKYAEIKKNMPVTPFFLYRNEHINSIETPGMHIYSYLVLTMSV